MTLTSLGTGSLQKEKVMPYKSTAQMRFFHTKTASTKGITPSMVNEFDQASKGAKLPTRVKPIIRLKKRHK